MKGIVGTGALLWLCLSGQGASAPATEGRTVLRSRSGQFAVANALGSAPQRFPVNDSDTGIVTLEPGTLVLTAERVRQALLTELRQPDTWKGRVYVVINPELPANNPALIGAQRFAQGWQYRLELPARIEPAKLVRGLTQVVLLELANRSQPSRSAEIPLWLSEGFTQNLLHGALVDLVVRMPVAGNESLPIHRTLRQQIGYDPLESTRQRLTTHVALSFSRMSELSAAELSEETWLTFQASTHLLLNRLLELPNARQAMSTMLSDLPHHLNWQSSFFNNFQPAFQRMLDVEKWWSVVQVQFTGVDALNVWSRDHALDKLDQLLALPVLVGADPQTLPQRQTITLQQILERWDYLNHQPLLQGVVNQLAAYRGRMPQELIDLVNGYQSTLEDYLGRRSAAGPARSLPGLPSTTADLLVQETVRKLDTLDQTRSGLRFTAPVDSVPDATASPTPVLPTPQ